MEWLATYHKWSHANSESLIIVQWPEQQSLVKTITRFSHRKANIQKFPGGLVTDPLARAC